MNKANFQLHKCPRCGIVLNRQYIRCPNCGHISFQSYISLVVTLSFILCFGPIWFYLNLQSGDFGWAVLVISTLVSVLGGFAIYRMYNVLRFPSFQQMQKRKDITGLIKMIGHPESEIGRGAVLALCEFGDERAIGPLAKALANKNLYTTRKAIVEVLEKFKSTKAIDGLISALRNSDPSAQAAFEALIRIGIASEGPLITLINYIGKDNEVSFSDIRGWSVSNTPILALKILGKIGGVSAIRPIINLASNWQSYSKEALESLALILGRHIVDASVEDLKVVSNLQGVIGVTGHAPIGHSDDDWMTKPIHGLLESEMSQLRLTAMEELKRRNIDIR